jgi:hypothetical protein
MGIDANGDLWLQANVGRSWFAFYVSGHIPPHEGPWIPKYLDSPIFPYDPTECSSWQALAIFSYTYRSLDECRRYAAAKSVLEQRKLRGYFVVESNGAIWLQSEDQLLRLAADGSTHPQGPLFEGSGLAPDPQGGIWVVSHDGLFHVTESTWQSIPLKPK